jgi:hypothetical protein
LYRPLMTLIELAADGQKIVGVGNDCLHCRFGWPCK